MKLVRISNQGTVSYGVLEGSTIRIAELEGGRVVPGDRSFPVDDVKLLAPVDPSKIICVGLNYTDHAEEVNAKLPERPLLFCKYPSSVVGPDEAILLPDGDDKIDYEAELAIVIGAGGRCIPTKHAPSHILGYTCLNDVSARDVQIGDGQWVRGKSFDTFCPVGPYIVTREEVDDPQDLRVQCRVDGVLLQDGSTRDMIFDVHELVSYISRDVTLRPGDVIATGTPAGVALGRDPSPWLREGNVVEVEIEGLGVLRNPVRRQTEEESCVGSH